MKDFDELRLFILKLPAKTPIRHLRLQLFDLYRYAEEYDKLYELVTELGGDIY